MRINKALILALLLTALSLGIANAATTTITVTDNGFPVPTYVNYPPASITEIRHLGANITYKAMGAGTYFMAETGSYQIITPDTINLTAYEVIDVYSTIVLVSSFDGGGRYYRRADNCTDQWLFELRGDDIIAQNFIVDDMRFVGDGHAIAITGDNCILQYVTLLNGSKYGLGFQGTNNSVIRRCYVDRAQYDISGSGAWSYHCQAYENVLGGPGSTVTRNNFKIKGLYNFSAYHNILYVNQGDADTNTKIGFEISTDSPGNNYVYIFNNTIIGNKTQTALSWGLNYNYHATYTNNNTYSSNNTYFGLDRGIWCDALSTGFTSEDDVYSQCTIDYTDNGANTFTNPISHDKPYYTDFPYYAGAYGVGHTVYEASNLVNQSGYFYGCVPSVYTKYTVDVEWHSGDVDGIYIYLGGIRLQWQTSAGSVRVYAGTQDGTVFFWTDGDNSTRAYFHLLVDTRRGGAWLFWPGDDQGALGGWVPFYYNRFQLDPNAAKFTPTHWSISDRANGKNTVHSFKQLVYSPDFAFAVGSNTHQALGFDGPRTWADLGMGLQDIVNLGMNCTIFADNTYIDNNWTYTQWLINQNFELGQHYNPTTLNTLINPEFEGNVTYQYNNVTGEWSKHSATYAVLGVGWLTNTSRIQYMQNVNETIQRAGRMVKSLPTSEQLIDSNFNYVDNGTTAGYAVCPLYTHETEPDPGDAGSISNSLWELWITHIATSPVELVGYYEWYMINANQHNLEDDATFVVTQGGTPTPPAPTNTSDSIIVQSMDLIQVFVLIIIANAFVYMGGARIGLSQEYLIQIMLVIAALVFVAYISSTWGL